MKYRDTFLATFLGVALASGAAAQVPYASAGQAYRQDFNLPLLVGGQTINGTLLDWRDNETFPGWFAAYYDGARDVYDTPTNLMISDGRGRTDTAFFLYHTATDKTDGALGSQPSDQRCPGGGSGGIFHGLCLVNATGETLTRLSLSYRVEFYRPAPPPYASQNTLVAFYRVGGDSLGGGIWKPIDGSAYATPATGPASSARLLDGNAPENFTAFSGLRAEGFSLAPGQRLWIRWFDVNNAGIDHGIGLDDVSLVLLP